MCHSININPDPKPFKVDLLLHCKTILHESEIHPWHMKDVYYVSYVWIL